MNPTPARPTVRVLIVDDNHDGADSLAALLDLFHFDVRVAYDGITGLRTVREYIPDCLIADIKMPGLDGYALARAVKADPALAGVKLVAMSAFADERHRRLAAEAGFEFTLTKAADPAELLEVLRMIEDIKGLAVETQRLALQNVELAGQTKELLQEVKADIKEVKQEVKELKKEVQNLKDDLDPGH